MHAKSLIQCLEHCRYSKLVNLTHKVSIFLDCKNHQGQRLHRIPFCNPLCPFSPPVRIEYVLKQPRFVEENEVTLLMIKGFGDLEIQLTVK